MHTEESARIQNAKRWVGCHRAPRGVRRNAGRHRGYRAPGPTGQAVGVMVGTSALVAVVSWAVVTPGSPVLPAGGMPERPGATTGEHANVWETHVPAVTPPPGPASPPAAPGAATQLVPAPGSELGTATASERRIVRPSSSGCDPSPSTDPSESEQGADRG